MADFVFDFGDTGFIDPINLRDNNRAIVDEEGRSLILDEEGRVLEY